MMSSSRRFVGFAIAWSATFCFSMIGSAQEELTPTVVVSGLNNPTGVAIQPDTGTVFIAESGAGRIVRLREDGNSVEPVVVGFPEDAYGKGPTYKIGPLSMAFRDKTTLVIGGGGRPDGDETIYVVAVPEVGSDPVNVESAKTFGPLAATEAKGETPAVPGEGNFFNVAIVDDFVYATSNGDDEKGWIARGVFEKNDPKGPLERFIATKPFVQVN
ncbi:MAG: hypothetical protein KDB27_07645, partial [Planctomycetales bacterium]|nr:hypothetical protein [Planctomycetales bacterium]